MASYRNYFYTRGYFDPTAGEAAFRVDKERGTLQPDKTKESAPKYHLAWKNPKAT